MTQKLFAYSRMRLGGWRRRKGRILRDNSRRKTLGVAGQRWGSKRLLTERDLRLQSSGEEDSTERKKIEFMSSKEPNGKKDLGVVNQREGNVMVLRQAMNMKEKARAYSDNDYDWATWKRGNQGRIVHSLPI